jgi:hypothetical protein
MSVLKLITSPHSPCFYCIATTEIREEERHVAFPLLLLL